MFSLSSPPQSSFYFRSYIPQTPSPLRTSHNANRMAMNHGVRSSPLSENFTEVDENRSPQVSTNGPWDTPSTIYSTSSTDDSKYAFTPATTASVSTPFTTSTNAPLAGSSVISESSSRPLFAFESRARSASPAAQLSTHAAEKRDKRKTQFLDRIRNRREDGRDERMEETVLRMDWVRERRGWEEEMRRIAEHEEEMEVESDDAGADVSPIEEKEIDELVQYLDDEEMDRDEYDEVFMEVLSHQPQNADPPSQRTQRPDDMDMS